jgi:hypothetical protein
LAGDAGTSSLGDSFQSSSRGGTFGITAKFSERWAISAGLGNSLFSSLKRAAFGGGGTSEADGSPSGITVS